MSNAPDVPRERFTAMTRLDHNRAVAQLAKKLGAGVRDVKDLVGVGQPLADACSRTCSTPRSAASAPPTLVDDEAGSRTSSSRACGKRGAEIIEARGASSAASAANAAIDHVHDWVLGADGLRLDGGPLGRRRTASRRACVVASRARCERRAVEIVEGHESATSRRRAHRRHGDELKERARRR